MPGPLHVGGAGRDRPDAPRRNAREAGKRDSGQRAEHAPAARGRNPPENRTPGGRRLETAGIVIEIGRRLVRGDQRPPMLVLPALRVVEAHGAQGLARAVCMADVRRELHHAVGGQDAGSVPLGAFHEVLTQVHDALVVQQAGEIRDRRKVGQGVGWSYPENFFKQEGPGAMRQGVSRPSKTEAGGKTGPAPGKKRRGRLADAGAYRPSAGASVQSPFSRISAMSRSSASSCGCCAQRPRGPL